MKTHDQIIEEYIAADSQKRLYLFLECPTMRNEFVEIDFGEYRSQDIAMKKDETAPFRSFLRRWRDAATNCCPMFRKA